MALTTRILIRTAICTATLRSWTIRMATFVGLFVFAIGASAQGKPEGSASAVKPSSTAGEKSTGKTGKKGAKAYPFEKLSEKEATEVLHAIEGRLSVGETVDAQDRRALSTLLIRHPSARVRAQATSVLPWLGPDVVGKAILRAMTDKDANVRTQGALGMNVISRRFEPRHLAIRAAASAAAIELLDDESDNVACAAVTLLFSLEPARAMEETRDRITEVSDVRHGCFRTVAQVPPREIRVESPTPPVVKADKEGEGKDGAKEGDDDKPKDLLPEEVQDAYPEGFIRGDGLFIATWAGAGLLVGGVMPASLFPPRDVLTYSRLRTSHAREEPSLVSAAIAAGIGAGALGAGAWALTEFVGPLDFAAASGVAAAAAAAGALSLGTTLAFGLDGIGVGAVMVGSSVVFMGGATALAYLVPPTPSDIAMVGAAAGLATVAGSLISFAVVPVGVEFLFTDVDVLNVVPRLDFGFGVGLMSGAAASVVALASSPLLDIQPARLAVTAGGGIAGASLGMLTAYIFTPTSVDIRPRLAAGAGLVGEVAGAALAFFLVPDAWLGVVEVADPNANGAVIIDAGVVKMGMPQVVGLAPAGVGTTSALSVPLLGGSF